MWIKREDYLHLESRVNELSKFMNMQKMLVERANQRISEGELCVRFFNCDTVLISMDYFKKLLSEEHEKDDKEDKVNEELCVVISSTNKFEFQELLNNNLNRGFEIIASSCNAKEYRAILCDKRLKDKNNK